MIDLVSVTQALLVAEHLSFSRAAQVLGVRQSAVSRRVRALEDKLGVSLFERDNTGVRITEAGRRFLERTRPALAEIDHAMKAAASAGRGAEGVIRIGILSSVSSGFLRNLLGGTARYAINAAAEAYMRAANLAHGVIDALKGADVCEFASEAEWTAHLAALGVTGMRVTPDPVRTASEGALWGAICAEDRLGNSVILSDDAGQFNVGVHALCWVHAERLVHKLVPANDPQRNAVEVARRMIWWFYRQLKDYKRAPSPQRAAELSSRFDRIFRRRTGYATLDRLLKRLHANKPELLRVLERPEIPLNTNASENDIRIVVTKRKVSGGTASERGRAARDVMLGLAKTCAKLKISFFHYLGARLAIAGPAIPPLPALLAQTPG